MIVELGDILGMISYGFLTLSLPICDHRRWQRVNIFFYIESFYNRQRRHSTLGYVSPEAYEATFYINQSLSINPGEGQSTDFECTYSACQQH